MNFRVRFRFLKWIGVMIFGVGFFNSVFLGAGAFAIEVADLGLESSRAIVFNQDNGWVLYEKGADERGQVASLTKIMTAVVALESGVDLQKRVTVTEEMVAGLENYAVLGLGVGDEVSVEELLYATLLPSAGDAAQGLAIAASGSIEGFVELMNAKAQELGLLDTHFTNVVGIDDAGNYSTAREIAKILQYALKNATFRKVFETNEYYVASMGKTIYKTTVTSAKGAGLDISVIQGAKTGFTYEAGRCLASTAVTGGVDYLAVTIGAGVDGVGHLNDALAIYRYFGENFGNRVVKEAGEVVWTIGVRDSAQTSLDLVVPEGVEVYLANAVTKEELEYRFVGVEEIGEGATMGDYLGRYQVWFGDEILYERDFYLETEIEFYPYWLWNCLVGGGVVVIGVGVVLVVRKKSRK